MGYDTNYKVHTLYEANEIEYQNLINHLYAESSIYNLYRRSKYSTEQQKTVMYYKMFHSEQFKIFVGM